MIDILKKLSVSGGTAETWQGMALLGVLGFALGFALNSGSVCTVIATRELISDRRPARSIALVECAVWAALVYTILDASPKMDQGWTEFSWLVPAVALFGLGTYLNGACVFGSVGHFGNGEINFGFVFIGIAAVFYIESVLELLPDRPAISGAVPAGPASLLIGLFLLSAIRFAVSSRAEAGFRQLTMSMSVAGGAFTVLAVLAPGFAITASVGSIVSIPVASITIFFCMFAGSMASARIRDRWFALKWPTVGAVVRRTVAGILMGLGALLIPGGNDTLLLIGLPMGAWQAVLAYALFVATLAALIARFGSAAKSWT